MGKKETNVRILKIHQERIKIISFKVFKPRSYLPKRDTFTYGENQERSRKDFKHLSQDVNRFIFLRNPKIFVKLRDLQEIFIN